MPANDLTINQAKSRSSGETHIAGRKRRAAIARLVTPRVKRSSVRGRRWSLIPKGGEGTRLQCLTEFIFCDDRPKQFCPLLGQSPLLKQAMQRAEVLKDVLPLRP